MRSAPNPSAEAWKPLVITVHGVGRFGLSGNWQPKVADALGEHFRFIAVRHHYYCLFAGLELVLEPLVLLLLIPLWLYFGGTRFHNIWIISLGMVLILITAYVARHWRHRLACESFRQVILGIRGEDKPPHLIAHSLGSYLSCRTLQDNPDLKFDRIVLVGSVVHEEFPWANLTRDEDSRYEAVFNEVAPLDLVVRAATLFRGWLPDPRFGSSGIAGFAGGWESVHYVNEPLLPCMVCEYRGDAVPIHNIQYRHAGHSTAFLEPEHASIFWVPYLWGYDPAQFAHFASLCADAERQEVQEPELFKNTLLMLSTASWGVPGLSVLEKIRQTPGWTLTPDREAKIILLTWRAIVRAQAAVHNPEYQDRLFWLRCLRPPVAIEYALNKVLGHGA